MREKKVLCSIVIVNWNSTDLLRNCINSIKKNTSVSYEIIVIDNNSKNYEQNELKTLDDIILIQNSSNVGFAAANNQGFKIVKGEYIFMLNPDTVLVNNAIDRLIDFLLQNNDIHAAAPKLYFSEKLDYHPSIKKFHTPLDQFMQMIPLSGLIKSVYSKIAFDPDKTKCVSCVWGAAIIFRKEVFENIGFLDERFFLYSEEVDFCRRMFDNGLKLYYHPAAEIIHYGGKSQSKSLIAKNVLLWESITKYLEKYFPKKEIVFYYRLLLILLKFKIIFLKRTNISPIYSYIKNYIKCEK